MRTTDDLNEPGAEAERDPPGFDNASYIRANPDVAEAIRRGDLRSAYQHYITTGAKEGRPVGFKGADPRNALIAAPGLKPGPVQKAAKRAAAMESLSISASGALMLVGWVSDIAAPLDTIQIVGEGWRLVLDRSKIMRLRRPDIEESLQLPAAHAFGLAAFIWLGQALPASGAWVVEYWLANGQVYSAAIQPHRQDDVEHLNALLALLAGASFLGNPAVEASASLDEGLGTEILKANRAIVRRVCAAPFSQRFSQKPGVPRGSIIVVLYGKPEFLFLQNALFAGLPGIEDYEFIYVSNSPEMAEALLQEARRSDRLYGLSQTLVILPGNAGFGAANNVGVAHARSNRILIINPDVFPRDRDWARRHVELIGAVRAEQCRLFGVPLYYDDGSLMHGGMYFEVDGGLTFRNGMPRTQAMVRVEHYGKGAPPETARFLQARPVPAVSGAFMSIDRGWFESLGGFSEDYVSGHYEDADLCLKSLDQNTPAWLQDLRMWHLEGKGSTRVPSHDGASLVNRWVFSRTWAPLITAELRGPAPPHPLIKEAGALLPEAPARPAPEPAVLRARQDGGEEPAAPAAGKAPAEAGAMLDSGLPAGAPEESASRIRLGRRFGLGRRAP